VAADLGRLLQDGDVDLLAFGLGALLQADGGGLRPAGPPPTMTTSYSMTSRSTP
jgi:hypothetical protein